MNTQQPNWVPFGSGTQTPNSMTAASEMDSMRTLGLASTEPLFIGEELGKGTSSELNTPEVVCTDWKFKRQTSHGKDHYATLEHDAFHPDREPSQADLVPYSSFSSSDPLEQRMNLESYFTSHGSLSKGSFTGNKEMCNMVQPSSGLEATLAEPLGCLEEEPSGYNLVSYLGDEDDKLPPDFMQLMDEILPSGSENVATNSTEFDMFSGYQDPLAEAIKFTGILEEDPIWSNLDKEVTTINMDDIEVSVKQENRVSVEDMDISFVTLSPASTSNHIEPAEIPEHVELSVAVDDPVPVAEKKRPKRRVKKPNRYRGTPLDEDVDSELDDSDAPPPSEQTKRPRESLTHLSEQEKYARIRRLNNEASKRCRVNKKKQMKGMESEIDILVKDNEKLKKKVQHLESLRDQIKDLVMRNMKCNSNILGGQR
ncbi:uncharacterized protein LOC143036542 isoform X2 [Oratosquilla oratoria]